MISYCVIKMATIADNIKAVTQRISMACVKSGRPEDSVKLICVTKEAEIPEIEEILALGIEDIGENRVQDMLAKYRVIGDRATWHLIGHLQTNKVKDAVKIAYLIHSVDSLKLAQAIDKEAAKLNKKQSILVQVNTSGEKSKFGITPGEAKTFFERAVLYPNINILGLMTMAPEINGRDEVRQCFRRLRELGDNLVGHELLTMNYQLSMGMTNDFEAAIEEGSTMVRIGRAIFK